MRLPDCEECRASIAELVEAYRAIAQEVETRSGIDREFAQTWRQTRQLKTEEDVALAEQVFPSIQLQCSQRVGSALNRMLVHETRTGHKPRAVLRQLRGQ